MKMNKLKGDLIMKEIDMTPYEEYFTELERLYFERNARMNIVAYILNHNYFTQEQYDKVYNDYLVSLKEYEKFISIFEQKVIIPICGPVQWSADFESRVVRI